MIMSDLTAKFGGLETQLAEQQTAMLSALGDIADVLGLINTALDTLNNNGATNTKYLLAAIGANNPCSPCPTPPLIIPPLGTAGSGIDEDKCKRVQAFLAFMERAFTVLDVASAVGVGFNPVLITDAYNQVVASMSGGLGPDAISFPEAVQLVGDLISYVATNLLVGDTLVGLFVPLYDDLRDAMYLTSDAAGAQSAYNSVIGASSASSYEKPVLIDAAYAAAYNYFFNPDSDPDLTGFDGTACVASLHDITSCVELASIPQEYVGHITQAIIAPPSALPNVFYFAGDYFGWGVEVIAGDPARGVDIYRTTDGSNSVYTHGFGFGAGNYVISDHGLAFAIVAHDADTEGTEFTVRICPPS